MTQPTDFIEQLAVMAERATRGPWEQSDAAIIVAGSGATVRWPPQQGCIASLNDGEYIENHNCDNDAAIIVLLRNNLPAILALGRERDALLAKYNELLFAVAQKFPDETRHETALRYINEREAGQSEPGQAIEGDNQ